VYAAIMLPGLLGGFWAISLAFLMIAALFVTGFVYTLASLRR
jgi:hypothetical protein